jgi:hypothetical protein
MGRRGSPLHGPGRQRVLIGTAVDKRRSAVVNARLLTGTEKAEIKNIAVGSARATYGYIYENLIG